MNSIPAMTPIVQGPCVTRKFTKPEPPPAAPGRPEAGPPEAQDRPQDGQSDAPQAVPNACLLQPGPQWRPPPLPGAVPLQPATAGQPLPYGGKGMPPGAPTLPVERPPTDALPGAPASGAPAAGPAPGLASESPVAARAADLAPAVPTPAAPGTTPPVTAAPEQAPSRQPGETVGRFTASPQSPAVPVLPASRAQGAGVDADARHRQPDPVAALRASPSAGRPVAPPFAAPADAVAKAPGEAGALSETTIRLAATADALPSSPAVHAAASPAAPQPAPAAQAAAPAAAMPMHLPEKVGSDDWNEALAQRLGQLVDSPHARASLRLNPPQLGPLQVEVHVDGDRAVVSFAVHHDATREALEQAMPRLRAQLEGSGFASIDVGVSHNPHRERTGAGEAYLQSAFLADEDLAAAAPRAAAVTSSRLLDAYA